MVSVRTITCDKCGKTWPTDGEDLKGGSVSWSHATPGIAPKSIRYKYRSWDFCDDCIALVLPVIQGFAPPSTVDDDD